jgi:hypothetical protein
VADLARQVAGAGESEAVAVLLARFYAHTYSGLLGVELAEQELVRPLTLIARALCNRSVPRRLDVLEPAWIHEIRCRAERYRRSAGLIQRLRALRGMTGRLTGLRDADVRLLDLGADDGVLVDLLLGRGWKRLLVGVDPSVATPRSWTREQGAVHLVPTLQEAGAISERFSVALASFTFHHMQPGMLTTALRQLSLLLRPAGTLMVLEDDPNVPAQMATPFDYGYADLSTRGRELALRVNDYWANVMVYDRDHADQVHTFRTVGGWLRLLRRYGFARVDHRRIGFNVQRLHGLPCAALYMIVSDSASRPLKVSQGLRVLRYRAR